MFQKNRIRKILNGVTTIVSFLFGAAILVLIFFAIILYAVVDSASVNPLYNRHLLLNEWRGMIEMIPIVYKLIFASLFFLATCRIFGWFKTRGV